MKATIHVKAGGTNAHHVAEAIFKAFARALRTALSSSGDDTKIQSSKGVL
jgi:imidazoleglycerol phosphate dehydratase HisB